MERLLFLTVSGKQKHPWQMWEPQTNICGEESVLFLTLSFTPLQEVLCLLWLLSCPQQRLSQRTNKQTKNISPSCQLFHVFLMLPPGDKMQSSAKLWIATHLCWVTKKIQKLHWDYINALTLIFNILYKTKPTHVGFITENLNCLNYSPFACNTTPPSQHPYNIFEE